MLPDEAKAPRPPAPNDQARRPDFRVQGDGKGRSAPDGIDPGTVGLDPGSVGVDPGSVSSVSATGGVLACEPRDDPGEGADKALRVIHVGPSMVRAGIEQWLKGLSGSMDPGRVKLVRCIATQPGYLDPAVAAELGVPVTEGREEEVRQAARECDILLCWGPTELGGWLADGRPKLCVFVAHGEAGWTRRMLEGCRPVVDHVVAVSRRVVQGACEGFPTTVIPNGVDTAHLARTSSRSETRRRLGFGPDDFVLGYVGRFSPEKRAHVLIEAVAKLPHRFKALLVGWGPLKGELLETANRLIPGRFAFETANGPVGDYYQAMDALTLVSEEEGFGLVVLEAMLCGRPVIAREVGCVPDLIQDRVSGLIVPGTPNSVRDAAMLLHDHPAWARGLAEEGRALADERGHARAMARRYEDLLLRLWAEKTAAKGP